MKDLIKHSDRISNETKPVNPRMRKRRRKKEKAFSFLREEREEYIEDVNEGIGQVLEQIFMACRSW